MARLSDSVKGQEDANLAQRLSNRSRAWDAVLPQGGSSLPDHFDVIAATNKQFEKEFGFRADQIVKTRLKTGLPTLIGMVYIYESIKRICPEVDRFHWLNQTTK